MMTKTIRLVVGSILLVWASMLVSTGYSFAERPNTNFVIVLIDDMGVGDLGCFGGKEAPTPHVDQLAKEGLRFTNFYVNAPICSPSRTALTTGLYPHRLRITSYLASRQLNRERGVAQWLDPTTPTLARQLQRAGYATGHFGKWHMGGQRDVGDAPPIHQYGFQKSLTNFEGLGPRVLPLNDAYDGNEPKRYSLGSINLGQGPIQWRDRSQVTTAFVDAAIEFIDASQKEGKPFLINLWPDDVHSPFFPPRELRQASDGTKKSLYAAVLHSLDSQLAKLFHRIRNDNQLSQNTMILLLSDNGHEEGAGSSLPYRGGKTWLYEGGIRSPLIVWAPGRIPQKVVGTTNDQSVFCSLDLNRSLHHIAGVTLEDNAIHDGEMLADTLIGRSTASRVAPIYWRRPPDRPGTSEEDNPDLAVRDREWKLLINYDGSQPQLYHLVRDPSETTNLASQQPELVARLTKQIQEWNRQMPKDAGDPSFTP